MKQLRITVKTPKGQAERTMNRQIESLIGFKRKKNIVNKKVINDHEFSITMQYENKELESITKRLYLAESAIKEFYKSLYKFIKKVNRIIKIGNKMGKAGKTGLKWLHKKVHKMLIKEIPDQKQAAEMKDNLGIDNVKIEKGLFKEITIDDREEMDKLLAGEIIKIKLLD